MLKRVSMGRFYVLPSNFDEEIIEDLLELMSDGNSMRMSIKKLNDREHGKDGKMRDVPSVPQIVKWHMNDVEGFTEKWYAARAMCLEARFDEIYDIASDNSDDVVKHADGRPRFNERGDLVTNAVSVQSRKLRIYAMQWELSKMLPAKFGTHKATDADDQKKETTQIILSKDETDL